MFIDLKGFLESFNHGFTLLVAFPAIVLIGVYLTVKLRFIQLFQLKKSFASLLGRNKTDEGSISRFGAISSVLAGNFGTGNISGMAVALATGGPGALVWMWIMAFFGAAIQYTSCVLGVAYRVKRGDYVGGPMYYLKEGLGFKKIAGFFAIFTLFGSITVGNFAQINSVTLPLAKLGLNPLYCSFAIAFLVGIVVLGGIKRISHFASYIVPVKAFLYLATALIIIALHHERVIPAFILMFKEAFGFSSVMGGVLGAGVLKTITTGFDRGLFATDAGIGTAPILQASTRSQNPLVEGLAALVAPLMVMIVCTATGLVLIVTDAWKTVGLQSTNMVTHAFSEGLNSSFGGYVVIGALILFAYTTILAWCYCGEKALEFLVGTEKSRLFRWVYLALIPVGSVMQVGMIWTLADVAITCMLIANLVGVVGLSKRVIDASREENFPVRN